MKSLMILFLLFLGLSIQAQDKSVAPVNPVALKYKATHHGYLGPVKTVDQFEFDRQGRLVTETGDSPKTFKYLKDAILVEQFGQVFTYKLNEKNQITGYTVASSDDTGSYTYDDNGNLIEEITTSDGDISRLTYTYDDQNRLISTTDWQDDQAYTTNYSYNGTPENLMIRQTREFDRTATVDFVYNNGVMVNYIFMGADNYEDVVLDDYGNIISFYSPAYDTTQEYVITYYQ
ncbi:hypothetical protein [Nonlabens agnitus]|nr:hypothetical protein [Nonlabens agnitus]